MIVFDSFDGANHLESVESKVNLISFSSTIANNELLTLLDYSVAKSKNILTWKQVATKEKLCILITTLQDHYQE